MAEQIRTMKVKKMCAEAKESGLNIVRTVRDEMFSDSEENSPKIYDLYINGTPEEVSIMDALLNELCGWTLESIIEVTKDKNAKNAKVPYGKLDIRSMNIWKPQTV